MKIKRTVTLLDIFLTRSSVIYEYFWGSIQRRWLQFARLCHTYNLRKQKNSLQLKRTQENLARARREACVLYSPSRCFYS